MPQDLTKWAVRRVMLVSLLAVLLSGGAALAQGSGSATLDAVRARGQLLCGTGGEIPGFSMLDSNGVMKGLDADYCRAIAAAVFGDANKVKFVPVTAQFSAEDAQNLLVEVNARCARV